MGKECPGCKSRSTHRLVGGGWHCLNCGWDFETENRDLAGVGYIEE